MLTAKQWQFVAEYLIDLNATQAAIRAGYSAKNADKIGSQLLGKTRVAEAIQAAMKERGDRTRITADYVLTTIQDTVERCKQAAPVLDRKGEQVYVKGPNGQLVPAFTFEPMAVLRGAELLGKHLKLFTEKTEVTGAGGGPLETVTRIELVAPSLNGSDSKA
jgi:phage terminase small subunit